MLKNAKHELFAQALADGLTQEKAYVKAGFSPKGARGAATRLCKQSGAIYQRRDELLTKREEAAGKKIAVAAEKTGVDKAWVLAQLIDVAKIAKRKTKRELTAANRALELIGKEFGMFIDRKEIRTGPLGALTDEQLDQLSAAIRAGTPAEVLGILGAPREAGAVQSEQTGVLPPLH